MASVCIIQTRLTKYRVPFFEALRSRLSEQGISLKLVHGARDERKGGRGDETTLPWSVVVSNRLPLGRRAGLVWQPVFQHIRDAELVIVTQENRLLQNYVMFSAWRRRGRKLAFWGHGRNFQGVGGGFEWWRRWQLRWPDWWFAYTSLSKDAIMAAGFPTSRISVLDNAVDTLGFRTDLASVASDELVRVRNGLGIPIAAPVGVFCSSLHAGKRIDFLLRAAEAVRRQIPDFHLVVIGTGPEKALVSAAAAQCPWIHGVGARYDREKALYLKLGAVFLMPYFVGLSILDAFCAGLPAVVVRPPDGRHSPEIAYLQDSINGIFTAPDSDSYGTAVARILGDGLLREKLGAAAAQDAARYTTTRMVDNFIEGIHGALACGHV